MQQWFNLSDPGVEEALYDSVGMRQFVGIDLGREPVPDETTVCKFRHLLERHGLGERIFERIGVLSTIAQTHVQNSDYRVLNPESVAGRGPQSSHENENQFETNTLRPLSY